jgi:hypothetical protein
MQKHPTVHRYADILESIRTIAPAAHIAGGAVRDTLVGKPLRDIDIFMDDAEVEEAATYLRSHFDFVKTGEWTQYLGFSDPAMTRVAKFEKAQEAIPVCIIGLRPQYTSPEANVARFDFGICMAAFDGKNVMRTLEFNTDVEAKTFTLCRADNLAQFSYSMSLAAEVRREYPSQPYGVEPVQIWLPQPAHSFKNEMSTTSPPALGLPFDNNFLRWSATWMTDRVRHKDVRSDFQSGCAVYGVAKKTSKHRTPIAVTT